MNANALRAILLVKNVEEQDPDGAVLPLAERDAATRDALRRWPSAAPLRDRQALPGRCSRRGRRTLSAKLAQRHPVVTRAVGLESQVASAGWLVLAGAFLLGLVLSLLDSRVRIEILAFPLLGVVLWNLVVYAILAVAAMRQGRAGTTGGAALIPGWVTWPARWGWQRAATLIKRSALYHRPLAAGAAPLLRGMVARCATVAGAAGQAPVPLRLRGPRAGARRRVLPARHRARISRGLGKHVPRHDAGPCAAPRPVRARFGDHGHRPACR